MSWVPLKKGEYLKRAEVIDFLCILDRRGVKVPKGYRNLLFMGQNGRLGGSRRMYKRALMELLRRYHEKVTVA